MADFCIVGRLICAMANFCNADKLHLFMYSGFSYLTGPSKKFGKFLTDFFVVPYLSKNDIFAVGRNQMLSLLT